MILSASVQKLSSFIRSFYRDKQIFERTIFAFVTVRCWASLGKLRGDECVFDRDIWQCFYDPKLKIGFILQFIRITSKGFPIRYCRYDFGVSSRKMRDPFRRFVRNVAVVYMFGMLKCCQRIVLILEVSSVCVSCREYRVISYVEDISGSG